jgi:hypothetical protein
MGLGLTLSYPRSLHSFRIILHYMGTFVALRSVKHIV